MLERSQFPARTLSLAIDFSVLVYAFRRGARFRFLKDGSYVRQAVDFFSKHFCEKRILRPKEVLVLKKELYAKLSWWTFWIFFIFSARGRGRGEPPRRREGGGRFFIENPRKGGGFRGWVEGGGRGAGRVFAWN